MTNEIIIDGVNVSECKYFQSSCVPDYSGGYLYKNVCRNHGFYDCDKKPCAFKCTEYQTQLKRKEQECEELETMVAEAKEAPICFRCSEEPCIRQERDKYKKLSVVFKDVNKQLGYKYITLKQALDEIEQTISNFPSKGIQDIPQTQIECTLHFLSVSETKLQKILDIINKAKEQISD